MQLPTALLYLMSLVALFDFSTSETLEKKCGYGVCRSPGVLCGNPLRYERLLFRSEICDKGQVCCVKMPKPEE